LSALSAPGTLREALGIHRQRKLLGDGKSAATLPGAGRRVIFGVAEGRMVLLHGHQAGSEDTAARFRPRPQTAKGDRILTTNQHFGSSFNDATSATARASAFVATAFRRSAAGSKRAEFKMNVIADTT
jgi:hypothetical protein